MALLLSNLSAIKGIGVPELLKEFGRHLFKQFLVKFPACFAGVTSGFEFLPLVDSVVHMEVGKLYSDAELPRLICVFTADGRLQMTYESERNLADLAEGSILGCLEHFGEQMEVVRTSVTGNPRASLFTLTRIEGVQ